MDDFPVTKRQRHVCYKEEYGILRKFSNCMVFADMEFITMPYFRDF